MTLLHVGLMLVLGGCGWVECVEVSVMWAMVTALMWAMVTALS